MIRPKEYGKTLVNDMKIPLNPSGGILIAIYTIIWGIWVANPLLDTFVPQGGGKSPTYGYMIGLAPEFVWGVITIGLGLYMFFSITQRSHKWIARSFQITMFWWIALGTFFFIGSLQGTVWINAFIIAIYCGYISINSRMNKDEPDPSRQIS